MIRRLGDRMRDSSIEWTDATWNPVSGCSVISPGCSNCYAMRMAAVAVVFEIAFTGGMLLLALYLLTAQADLRQMVIGWLTNLALAIGFID